MNVYEFKFEKSISEVLKHIQKFETLMNKNRRLSKKIGSLNYQIRKLSYAKSRTEVKSALLKDIAPILEIPQSVIDLTRSDLELTKEADSMLEQSAIKKREED